MGAGEIFRPCWNVDSNQNLFKHPQITGYTCKPIAYAGGDPRRDSGGRGGDGDAASLLLHVTRRRTAAEPLCPGRAAGSQGQALLRAVLPSVTASLAEGHH